MRLPVTWLVTLIIIALLARGCPSDPPCPVSSARNMPSVIVISDDEQDEQTVVHRPNLSSPIPPERFLANSGSSTGEQKAKVNLKLGPPVQKKRRRVSDADVEDVEVKDVSKAKKAKREERKAVSNSVPVSSLILWRRRVLTD
jgi:hypothetical protein